MELCLIALVFISSWYSTFTTQCHILNVYSKINNEVNAMITSVFTNNRSQAVRLPAIFRFPKETQKVFVRVVGVERVI